MLNRSATFLLLLPCLCAAQPVITTSSQPQPGDQCVHLRSLDIAPFASGPGVSWDFTGETFEPFRVVQYVEPDGLAGASLFPSATVAELHVFGPGHTFMQMSPSAWTILGAGGEGSENTIVSTDPLLLFPFPWTFGTNWEDIYSYLEDGEPVSDMHTWESNTHGTLILPSGLQLEVVGMARESVQIGPGPPEMMVMEATLELWAPGYPCRVVEIDHAVFFLDGEFMSEFRQTVIMDDTQSSIGERMMPHTTRLWPNPATNSLHIRGDIQGSGHAQLQVRDATGRLVQQQQCNVAELEQGTTIPVHTPSHGVYMLHAVHEGVQAFSLRFVIE